MKEYDRIEIIVEKEKYTKSSRPFLYERYILYIFLLFYETQSKALSAGRVFFSKHFLSVKMATHASLVKAKYFQNIFYFCSN